MTQMTETQRLTLADYLDRKAPGMVLQLNEQYQNKSKTLLDDHEPLSDEKIEQLFTPRKKANTPYTTARQA